MARPGTTSPDLVAELRALRGRIEALERKPVPQTFYDKYPSIEWAAIGRGTTPNNVWSSCGVANVTGLKYDRVECKFITNRIIRNRSEVEVRLAAFRHDYANQSKECVSASRTLLIRGKADGSNVVGVGKWRWIHGIPFGWDYTDEDNAVYTIELQHRYPDGETPTPDSVRQVFAYSKWNTEPAIWARDLITDGDGTWAPALTPVDDTVPTYGWVDVQSPGGDVWDGTYMISNMHYCVGMDQSRLPDATVPGWFWYTGAGTSGGVISARPPDITEPYFSV